MSFTSANDFTFGVDTTGETQANNTYQWTDNFSKAIGKHTLKLGAGLHFDQVNIHPDAAYNGSFQFDAIETGSDLADFLLGIASYYRQGDSKSFYLRNKYVGWFGQDSWQVKPRTWSITMCRRNSRGKLPGILMQRELCTGNF